MMFSITGVLDRIMRYLKVSVTHGRHAGIRNVLDVVYEKVG